MNFIKKNNQSDICVDLEKIIKFSRHSFRNNEYKIYLNTIPGADNITWSYDTKQELDAAYNEIMFHAGVKIIGKPNLTL